MASSAHPAGRLHTMRSSTLEALAPTGTGRLHPEGPAVSVAAPGRVNLVGEHTDYNEGRVLPLAIDRWIVMSGRARAGREVHVTALDRAQEAQFSLDGLDPRRRGDVGPDWARYVAGVLWALQDAGERLAGMELAFTGNVPQGMGLSSSAALEVATGWLVRELSRLDHLSKVDVALLGQKAENQFVGVACGIMDLFASALGSEGDALLLDCRSRAHRWIRIPEERAGLVVVYGDRGRELVDSGYNARRDECERSVACLREMDPDVRTLRDAGGTHLRWLDKRAEGFPGDHERAITARRSRHVVEEDGRVIQAVDALERGDVDGLGELLSASHASLRDLFEVSTPELDRLVRELQGAPGCVGARLVGGGFGGAVLALVERDLLHTFLQRVERGGEGAAPADGKGNRPLQCHSVAGVRKL